MFLCHLRRSEKSFRHNHCKTICSETICSVSLGASTAWYNQIKQRDVFLNANASAKGMSWWPWVSGKGWISTWHSGMTDSTDYADCQCFPKRYAHPRVCPTNSSSDSRQGARSASVLTRSILPCQISARDLSQTIATKDLFRSGPAAGRVLAPNGRWFRNRNVTIRRHTKGASLTLQNTLRQFSGEIRIFWWVNHRTKWIIYTP